MLIMQLASVIASLSAMSDISQGIVATHEVWWSFYVRKQQLLSARLSHRNSVCPSVTRVNQSKMVKIGSNLHRRLPGRL